jgi:hypothetical protein
VTTKPVDARGRCSTVAYRASATASGTVNTSTVCRLVRVLMEPLIPALGALKDSNANAKLNNSRILLK